MSEYQSRWAEQRRQRAESHRRIDERTREAAAALGLVEGGRYDLRVRYENRARLGRDVTQRTRMERGLRWSGRVNFGLIEFYVRRPAPDGPEHSRFVDPADIQEVVALDPEPVATGPVAL